jgi:hypothetical protein
VDGRPGARLGDHARRRLGGPALCDGFLPHRGTEADPPAWRVRAGAITRPRRRFMNAGAGAAPASIGRSLRRGRRRRSPPGRGPSPIRAKTCPWRFKSSFLAFFRGCPPSLSAARTLTLWIVSNGPHLLPTDGSSLSGIAWLSGPIWDRAHRVTPACHLQRIASKHDRRMGWIGDGTDHLCPCPSRLRWTLPEGREGWSAKGGRTDRWPQMTAIRSQTILL